MKLYLIVFCLMLGLLIGGSVSAQISQGGIPISFKYPSLKALSNIPSIEMAPIDMDALIAEDAIEEAEGDIPFRFGTPFDVNYNLDNSGLWEDMPDGGRLWLLRIESPGAYTINLIYDKYYLPQGAKLYLYNENQDMIIGAFTNANNKEHGMFSTRPVKGDITILEYYEPADVRGLGELSISRIVHGYKDIFKYFPKAGFNGAGSCNVNINCPEGDEWQKEKRAIVMTLLGGGTRWCTGSLVNNTREDETPYFLTANHCLGSEETWIFMFNYESPDCTNIDGPTDMTLQGSTLRANYDPSDMALLEISENPPAEYGVYYAGWSNQNKASQTSITIHHPSGDIKKISVDYDSLTSSSRGDGEGVTHWRVGQWEIGTTENGSSGSPLFNSEHHVVGQLHGGFASCQNSLSDWYGKFSYSWEGGGYSQNQLSSWLDPDNTGVTSITGFDPGALINIKHIAQEDTRDTINDIEITCEITADSGLSSILYLRYYIGLDYHQEILFATANPNEFSATIPAQSAGVDISYYFYAEDNIGNIDSTNTFYFDILFSPKLTVSPSMFIEETVIGLTSTEEFTITNTGNSDLFYEIFVDMFIGQKSALPKKSTYGYFQPASRSYPADYYDYYNDKNENDTRIGYSVESSAGGPDGFGYFWLDSDDTNGPAFEWIDISSTGTDITSNINDDNYSGPYSFGFDFPFYGTDRTEFYLGSNGLIGFNTSNLDSYSNSPLPSSGTPNDIIAWLWTDLNIDDPDIQDERVYYETIGDRLIIQFDNYPKYGASAGDVITAQVFLDSSGAITLQYLSIASGFTTDGCSIGIENDSGTDGLEVAFMTPYLKDSLAIKFSRMDLWLTLSNRTGTVLPGETDTITCNFLSGSLEIGTYNAQLSIASNDPNRENDPLIIPVELNVIGIPYTCGDADGSGSTNLGDAIYLVNFIFKGGPPPNPLESGDANCDGRINIGDCVYIINYIFKNGNAPCCPYEH